MLHFQLLGPLRVARQGTELSLGPRQQRLILALLLARAGQVVLAGELTALLWGDDPPASAANVVHRYVGALRRLFEPELPTRAGGRWITSEPGGYRLHPGDATVDLLAFRELSKPGAGLDALLAALALWHGRCAAGLEATHPVFVAVDREHAVVAAEAARLALEDHRPADVLPALHQAATWEPLNETLHARLMLVLAADGRQAEAIGLYQQLRQRLDVELGVHPGADLENAYREVLRAVERPPAVSALVRPAQLPSDLPGFGGRDALLRELTELVRTGHRTVAIDGMPGVGKTSLAVHLAHGSAAAFPDGVLFADLHGFDPAVAPSGAAEVLQGFLEALGVPLSRIPAGTDARAGQFRSVLADRRVLIVLDNAHDVTQVRPLLPGEGASTVVVTSRRRLTGLATGAGARLFTLDVPDAQEARALLAARLGDHRAAAEPAALEEVAERCGRLPLALAIVAARAGMAPHWPLSAIAAELRDTRAILDAFSDDDLTEDLRAVFSWSHRMLSPAAARLFRLLALHPGPELSVAAAASLAAESTALTRTLLSELARIGLAARVPEDRYKMHDLVRAYALELLDDALEREAAVARILSHYTWTAAAVDAVLLRRPPSYLPEPAPPGVAVTAFAETRDALAWCVTHRDVLRAVTHQAADRKDARAACVLAVCLSAFYQRQGWWNDWADVSRTALAAATVTGDVEASAFAERSLAGAYNFLGDHDSALRHLVSADGHFAKLGRADERARVLINIGSVRRHLGAYEQSLVAHLEALTLIRDLGRTDLEPAAMGQTALAHVELGHYADALALLRAAETMFRDRGDVNGQGIIDWNLGWTYRRSGDPLTAIDHYAHAVTKLRQAGSRANLALCLIEYGDALDAAGRTESAIEVWLEALPDLTDLESPAVLKARIRLGELGIPRA
ncbi:BTAD domain-containing putative transcriptional regulator [Winogradskya consettensis]|uniref:SARP family transcriptional regulator n=1 Tax=Winogradskya consettensis TaxID=113560 RepID=A0A919VY21_9ACTN|nr:BTAD domain-containing putative transcriptional regulator [Actinoplanes consettensis]GIM79060.1 SARP family transcriptional regulator [Actinoplanes consettensis]